MRQLEKTKAFVREAKGHIERYCAWASEQTLNRLDLLVLGFGPIALLGIGLMSLPAWICWAAAAVLVWPALYAAFLILRTYSQRGESEAGLLTSAGTVGRRP